MSKNLKRLVGIGVAISILASTAVGCGINKDNIGSTDNGIEKPSKITFGITLGLEDNDGKQEFLDKFKELTGVELEIFAPPHNQYFEKLDTAFSSGTAPDVMAIGNNALPKYASIKAVAQLDKYIQNSEEAKNIEPKVLEAIKLNNKTYGIPLENSFGTITYIRKDWLQETGLNIPKTYSEFYTMLKSFKDIKAPNNATTIPLTSPGFMWYMYLTEFYQDARPEFVKKNGKWVDGFTEPEMQPALERLSKAYADGLIDKEIFTNKTSDCRDKFYAGRVGVFNYWAGTWADTLITNLKKGPAGNSADMIGIEPLKGVKYVTRTPAVLAMNEKSTNKDGVWKYFFETFLDGNQGSRLFTAGVEGVHFKTKDTNSNILEGLPMRSNPSLKYAKSYFDDTTFPVSIKYSFDYPDVVRTTRTTLLDNMVMDELIPMSNTRNKKGGDIQTLREQLIAQVIKGDKTAAQAIEEYTKKSDENEVVKILQELNSNN